MENLENEEKGIEVVENSNYIISDFGEISNKTDTKTEIITNIKDNKKLFNLENNVDYLLNDCEGEIIRVKDVLIKRYEKPLKNPILDDETGEILKDKEYSMSCVIVDDEEKSYATGSKVFAIQLLRYLHLKNIIDKSNDPFEIKITKKKYGEKGNKALSFELV